MPISHARAARAGRGAPPVLRRGHPGRAGAAHHVGRAADVRHRSGRARAVALLAPLPTGAERAPTSRRRRRPPRRPCAELARAEPGSPSRDAAARRPADLADPAGAARRSGVAGRRGPGRGAPGVVLSDHALEAIASARPADPTALLAVRGIGPVNADRYGDGPRWPLVAEHAARADAPMRLTARPALRRRRRRRSAAAYTRPRPLRRPSSRPEARRAEVVDHEVDGDLVLLRVRYRFIGELSSARGRRRPEQAHLGPGDRPTTSPRARPLGLLPDHYADRLRAAAPTASSRPTARQPCARLEGDVKVRAPLVGGRSSGARRRGSQEHLAPRRRSSTATLDA